MDIKRVAINEVNEILVVNVEHMDYKGQVQKRINEKMPLATIKGFRKGKVPRSIVEKFYGKEIKQEEVGKVVALALDRFIKSENLGIIGTPILKINEDFDWNAEELVFNYEIGLMADFKIDFEAKNDIIKYTIIADDDQIEARMREIQKRSGKVIPQDVVTADSDVVATFISKEGGVIQSTTLPLSVFRDKKYTNKFIDKKVGDVVNTNLKNLFADDYYLLINYLKASYDELLNLDVDAITDFTIKGISTTEPEELNQKMLDDFFGEGKVTSTEELKAKIKIFEEIQYAKSAYEKLIADIEDFLVENTKFEMPSEFLMKWFQSLSKEDLLSELGKEGYTRAEKNLRLKFIKEKILFENNIKVSFEEVKEFITELVGTQLTLIKKTEPTVEELQAVIDDLITNEEEMKTLFDGMLADKLSAFLEEKMKPTTKEITHREFIKIVYKEFIETAYN